MSDLYELVLARDELADLDPAARRLALREVLAAEVGEDRLPEALSYICDRVDGFGPVSWLMSDPSVTDILINGPDEVWCERSGVLERCDVSFPEPELRAFVERMVGLAGGRIDASQPMADAKLPDGSRLHVVLPPLAPSGPLVSIRRFPSRWLDLDGLIRTGMMDPSEASLLRESVIERKTIVVSGPTGSGKTTLLAALLGCVPEGERVVLIEETPEIPAAASHLVSLVARPSNVEGRGEVSLADLVKTSLRMRPDRIVVGEVRGAEALDMLQAMNTGHEGSLTTVHANSPRDALSRIETMVLFSGLDLPLRAVREQVASALDVIIQLERRSDGKRVVSLIAEVQGREGETVTMQDVYKREGTGDLVPTGLRPSVTEKLASRGVKLVPALFRGPAAKPAARSRSKRSAS
ncbi:MAG: CpaF family protein [Actinomycetota bacterium]